MRGGGKPAFMVAVKGVFVSDLSTVLLVVVVMYVPALS